MAKYKVGDKVQIVSKAPMAFAWTSGMNKYLGQIMTVRRVVDDGIYKMKEDLFDAEPCKALHGYGLTFDGWTWAESWISGLAEEPKEPQETPSEPISVHIRFCGPLTVAELMKGGKVVKVANAKCNPKDTYDRGEGAKVAVNQLFEKKQKAVEEPVNPVKKWKAWDKAVVVRQNGKPYHWYHIPAVVEIRMVDPRDNTCLCRNMDDHEHVQWVRMDCLEPYKEGKK